MSRFLDSIILTFQAGNGGAGISAFRKVRFRPMPLPEGGSGGGGADIVIVADPNLTSLAWLSGKIKFKADDGAIGKKNMRTGKKGNKLIIKVPIGTQVLTPDGKMQHIDLCNSGDEYLIVTGGKGGLGNGKDRDFKARPGTLGELKIAKLELKTIADIGLIGFPNAGKSSLISVLTNAHPEVANYEFTTLRPHLGILASKNTSEKPLRIADLPGLIDGAAENRGLGNKFLKHIERCSVLVHMLDFSQDVKEIQRRYEGLNHELNKYNANFKQIKKLIIGTKIDLPQAQENVKLWASRKLDYPTHFVSSVSKEGVEELKIILSKLAKNEKSIVSQEIVPTLYSFAPGPEIQLKRTKMGSWDFFGLLTDKLNAAEPGSEKETKELIKLNQILESPDVKFYFEEAGVKKGDTINVNDRVFTWG